MNEMFENEVSFDVEITEENKKMFEELFSPWDRFQNGTETINDIINNCPRYGFEVNLYGEDNKNLMLVEEKHFERVVNVAKKMAEWLAKGRKITAEEVLERFDKEEK